MNIYINEINNKQYLYKYTWAYYIHILNQKYRMCIVKYIVIIPQTSLIYTTEVSYVYDDVPVS